MLAERGMPLDLVLELDVPEEVLLDRLAGRGRPDDDRRSRPRAVPAVSIELTEPLVTTTASRGVLRDDRRRGHARRSVRRGSCAVDVAEQTFASGRTAV